MASYGYDPYSDQNAYGNPTSNGYAGARTDSSVANAAVQRTARGGGGSGIDSFGAAADAWADHMRRRRQKPATVNDPKRDYLAGRGTAGQPPQVVNHPEAFERFASEMENRNSYLRGLVSAPPSLPGAAAPPEGSWSLPPSSGPGPSLPGAPGPADGSWSLPPSAGPSPSLPGSEAPPIPPPDSLPPSTSVPITKRGVMTTNSAAPKPPPPRTPPPPRGGPSRGKQRVPGFRDEPSADSFSGVPITPPYTPRAPGTLDVDEIAIPPQLMAARGYAAGHFDGPLERDQPPASGPDPGSGGAGNTGPTGATPPPPPQAPSADPMFDSVVKTPGFEHVTQGAIGEYRLWVDQNKANGVDLVDWLYHTHPEMLDAEQAKQYIGRNSPLDQRAKGMDTYKAFTAASYAPTLPGKGKTKEAGPNPTAPEDANGAADRYATTPGFERLKGRGDIVQEYRNWVVSDERGRSGVDIVDWLVNKHPELADPNDPNVKKLIGRQANGLDTYKWAAPGIARMGEAPTSGSGADQTPYSNTRPKVFQKAPRPGSNEVPPPAGAPAPGAPGATQPPPAGAPPAAPPPGTPPPATTPGDIHLPPSLRDQLMYGLSPQFNWEQRELNRRLNAQAGFTGDSNAGGFGNVRGNANSQLVADEGKRVTDYMQQADQAERDRQLKIREMDLVAETQRYGINKNDDLQRWLNDPHNDTLQRYGIDKNDLLQRYQAQLQLQGVQYSADAQVNAAALHAAAAGAAAAVESQRAEQDYQLGLKRLSYDDIFNQRGYDLGVLGINRDIYTSDQNDRYRNTYLKWLMSPDARIAGERPTFDPAVAYGG
jgi:hypothetical protein